MEPELFDLIVIGGTPAGLSLAAEAQASGLEKVLVLERGESVTPQDAAGRLKLQVRFQCEVSAVNREPGCVELETTSGLLSASAVAYAEELSGVPNRPTYALPNSLQGRVLFDTEPVSDEPSDVLVVGGGELAAEYCERLVESGHRLVLAFQGEVGELSRLSQDALATLERDRQATILWRSCPTGVEDIGGFPMAYFEDRRTPDLQFDFIVYALGSILAKDVLEGLTSELNPEHPRFFVLVDSVSSDVHLPGIQISAGTAWDSIRLGLFEELRATPRQPAAAKKEELCDRHYNATITHFAKAHSDLWLIRIRPDSGNTGFQAGQYATIGLGYWEPRIDDAIDSLKDGQIEKLVRRSYSISSPIFDEQGYLASPFESDELEFYIVLVPASDDRVPSLTPRLALKEVGDRVYLGPKISGRYSLAPITDPSSVVVFLATGTGEAPHNAMISQLLRRGHYGPIVSVVTVRRWSDLGYRQAHVELEKRYQNYSYVALPTREEDVPKQYIQDFLTSSSFETAVGGPLEPENTAVFLCGNPAMIGPPTWDGDTATFPEPKGAVEVLTELGLTPDRRGVPGNIHFEEYW